MDKKNAENRIKELKKILLENSRKYYVENNPTMSDYDYDQLMHELENLEKEYPEFITKDSPTQNVGSDLENSDENTTKNEFVQYAHKYPMLSLGNTYSIGEVEDFATRATKALDKQFDFCCELKFDGTAICLTYVKGKLFRALTRGDGTMGDDVTENVKHIKNIPQKLKGNDYPEEFEIRGEIVMPFSSFDKLNEDRIKNEETPFANPRNAASGSLKLTDPKEVGKRGLYCILYHIPGNTVKCRTHTEALEKAESWGLPISHNSKLCKNIQEIEDYINYWDDERKKLPYATDGIVIKINELDFQTELGYTSKFPRWAVAYKFKAEQALTEILSIDYQVGRTGAVTPVANLSPVFLSGTMVKRATLNNADLMAAMDIRVGDFVYVEKGGEIIPKITSVELKKRPKNSVVPKFPQNCPDCGTPLIKAENEAKYYCPNNEGCPTQIKGRLLHFVGRKAMDILAGEATIEQLYDLGLVRTIADFYDLTAKQLLKLDGWQEKSANNLIESIKASTKIDFAKVLFAIGIRNVGEITAKTMAKHFENIDNMMKASKEELIEVSDIGEIIADSIYDFFREEKNIVEIERLRLAGLQLSLKQDTQPVSTSLEGKTIVISGNFSISRNDMKALIEEKGGKNSSSISGKTSFILAGTKPGPEKMKKAVKLGIPVISENDFYAMIKEAEDKDQSEPNLFNNN